MLFIGKRNRPRRTFQTRQDGRTQNTLSEFCNAHTLREDYLRQIAIGLLLVYEKLIDFVFLGLSPEEQKTASADFSDVKAKLADLVVTLKDKKR